MSTRRLYYEQPYLDRFEAVVARSEPRGAHWAAVLDRTAFYPEGGGQPADLGRLAEAAVLDVREREGEIEHLVDLPLPVGQAVEGRLDWPRRFSLMQHHTGEHILSGVVKELFGLENVGFHMGAAMVTIDFDGPLDAGRLAQAELLANRAVWANRPVTADYPPPGELAGLSYRSKKALTGAVRIVTVEGTDRCACCGTHVARAGEVGLIKLVAPQSHKGGVRVGLLCGERALEDYRRKDQRVGAVSALLSVKQDGVVEGVERLRRELEDARRQRDASRDALFAEKCAAHSGGAETLCLFEEGLSSGDLRRCCLRLIEQRPGLCAVLSDDGAGGHRYALGGRGQDARALSRALHAALGGRGGGSAELAQGSLPSDRPAIAAYFAEAWGG